MSWKKYFRSVNNTSNIQQIMPVGSQERGGAGTSSKISSYLPEVYAGHPNRIQRYYQYDDMDRDSDINAALDTIADFCTQSEEQNEEPFEIRYTGNPNETEISLLKTALTKWTKINEFRSRLWHMFRSTIKNGDAFFLRDPETGEWLWIDTFMVEMVKVDDSAGKEPDEYIVRGLDYNKQAKFATLAADPSSYRSPLGASNAAGARPQITPSQAPSVFSLAGSNVDPRQRDLLAGQRNQLCVVSAEHVIHLSLSVGMDVNWPFGASILEPVFKTYKQKELLEDSVIIYRVQRAPERRIFYIDTGSMPPPRAKAHIEQIKNEIHQRRIPNRSGGGGSILDTSYSPLSMLDDYYFAVGCIELSTLVPLLDGRTLTFSQIIEEYNQGKVNYTYSLNTKTHEFEPGKIAWAGVTRRNAELVRVTLDNGEYVDTTPDHKFILRDGSEIHAEDLKPKDALMPLYRRPAFSGKNQKKAKYDRIVCNATGKSKFTHLLVQPKPPGRDFVVHHKDFNSANNNPDNLEVMTWQDHEKLHKAAGTYSVGKQWSTPEGRERMIAGMQKFHRVSITPEQKQEMSERNRKNGSVVFKGKHADKVRQQGRNNFLRVNKSATLNYSMDMFNRLVEIYNQGNISLKNIIPILNDDPKFQELFEFANKDRYRFPHQRHKSSLYDRHIRDIVKVAGFSGWDDFRMNHPKTELVLKSFENEHLQRSIIASERNNSRIMNFTPEMFERMVEVYNEGYNSISKMRRALMNDNVYQSLFSCANENVKMNKGTGGIINARSLTKLAQAGGYDGWDDFKSTYSRNHKVLSVVRLTERENTGDLTIESASDSHVFALGIGVYVHNSEGRGSKVETLPGGEMTGEIGDLLFFSKKLARGLRIPSTYLALGGTEEQGSATYNDGKLGSALIQEFRFNKYCMRIQSLLAPKFDKDFKKFLRKSGIEIDEDLFELQFLAPQNFTKYRQIEVDAQQVQVYTQLAENKKLSERFKLKRFLNLKDDELLENEKLWAEENAAKLKKATGSAPSDTPSQDLSSVGISRGGGGDFGDIGGDIGGGEEPTPDEGGGAAEPPPTGGASAPPPPPPTGGGGEPPA